MRYAIILWPGRHRLPRFYDPGGLVEWSARNAGMMPTLRTAGMALWNARRGARGPRHRAENHILDTGDDGKSYRLLDGCEEEDAIEERPRHLEARAAEKKRRTSRRSNLVIIITRLRGQRQPGR